MRSDVRKIAYISRRALALLLTLVMVLAIVPPIDIFAASQDDDSGQIVFDARQGGEYYHKPIVINQTTMTGFKTNNEGRYNILIRGEPFSVTVQGLKNVDITFDNVTVNRAADTINRPAGSNAEEWIAIEAGSGAAFLQASQDLGWSDGNNNHFVPTCPFWIRDGAEVVASFIGNNVFKASGNLWRIEIEADDSIADQIRRTKREHYHGYAGIQIAPDSALTIENGTVEAWGAYQMSTVTTVSKAIERYPLSFSKTTEETSQLHPDVSTNSWAGNNAAGGAGIGGGANYNDTTDLTSGSPDDYYHFTPGSITINTGNVTAIGGFKAAGIGGAVNGALTAVKITINGDPATTVNNKTIVNAIGSFFAAGIGEGDSVPSHESSAFTNPYELEINGGVVTARGGYKAAGIGTTDEISDNNSGETSGLSIALNGGDITAISGRAADNNRATAAIGAGDGTDMEPYSITIAEGTIVKATSFSKYAISNIGTSQSTVPQTVVDPNTYMYLAYYTRTEGVSSSSKRTFELHQIKRTERNDFMIVAATSDEVLDTENGVPAKPTEYVYFGYDEVNKEFYLVNHLGQVIADQGTKCAAFYLTAEKVNGTMKYNAAGTDENGNTVLLQSIDAYKDLAQKIQALSENSHLSYYFVTPSMKKFEVPADYTAVAMTLYPPEDFGGRYIFHIPITNDDVYAVIEKMSSGESSGKITADVDPHFIMGDPIKPDQTPSVTPDKVSAELTNLTVTSGTGEGTKTHLGLGEDVEQIFAPGTKSYKIWLPVGTTSFTVSPMWSAANNTTYTVTVRQDNGTKENIASGATKTFNISTDQVINVWIEKKDSNATNSIVYKLTVRVKAKYTIFPKDLNKMYDGMTVIPGYDLMITGTERTPAYKYSYPEKRPTTETKPEFSNIGYKVDSDKHQRTTISVQTGTNYWGQAENTNVYYRVSASVPNSKDQVVVTVQFYSGNSTNTPSGTATVTYKFENGTLTATQGGDTSVTISRNSYNISLANDVLTIGYDPYTPSAIYSYSYTKNPTGTSTYDQAVLEARASGKSALENSDDTSAVGTANYEINQTIQHTAIISTLAANNVCKATITATETIEEEGTVSVTVTRDGYEGDVTDLLTGETITYTYTQTHDAAGNDIADVQLEKAPKDAGQYEVKAVVNATEFEANGSRDFTISKRPITIIGIENWRYYLKTVPNNPENTTIPITPGTGTDETKFYSGQIRLDGVVEHASGEIDAVTPTYTSMYFVNSVVGNLVSDKIAVYATLNEEGVNANYTFAGYPANGDYKPGSPSGNQYVFYVPGQVTYDVDGAMFGYGDMTDNGTADFLWYKYYPVIDDWKDPTKLESYLKFPNDPRIDYHSPNSQSHAEHIYVRTVNKGVEEARYAVDITFGSMIFQYTKTIWNVNTLTYDNLDGEDGDVSVWVDPTVSGFAHKLKLTSGDVLIENRSNREISFKATATINTHCVMITYDKATMEFDEALMNKQHRIAARMIWGDTNEWKDDEITAANSVNTGKSGVATTPLITIPAATNVGIGASESDVSQAPGYKVVSVRLFGIPTATETVGGITISLTPTT